MKFAHLGYRYELTLAQVQAHNTTTNKAVVDVLYIPSDAPQRWFVGNADGSVRELFMSDNYVKSTEQTATATPTVDANGKLTVDTRVSADAGNAISAHADGLFASIPADYIQSVEATSTATPEVDVNGKLTVAVKKSADAGNAVELRADGLFVSTPADYIQSVSATDTATPSVDVDGDLTVVVNVSGDAGNTVEARADGLFSPDFAIHTDSANYLEKVGNEIRVKKLLIKDVKVVSAGDIAATQSANATPDGADWLTNNLSGYEEGDMVMIPSENKAYVRTATAWEQIKYPDFTEAQLRTMLGEGSFISISSDNTITVKNSADAGNDIVPGADGGLFVDVDQTLSIVNAKSKTIQQHLIDLDGAAKTFENGIEESSNVVTLGGALTGNTNIGVGAFELTLDGPTKLPFALITDENDDYYRLRVDSIRQVLYLESYVPN